VKFGDATPTERETKTAAAASKHQQHSMFPSSYLNSTALFSFSRELWFQRLNHATEHPDTEIWSVKSTCSVHINNGFVLSFYRTWIWHFLWPWYLVGRCFFFCFLSFVAQEQRLSPLMCAQPRILSRPVPFILMLGNTLFSFLWLVFSVFDNVCFFLS